MLPAGGSDAGNHAAAAILANKGLLCPMHPHPRCVSSQRKKLRADLAGSSQEEIRQMRMAGQEVTEVHEVGTGTGEVGQWASGACQCAGTGCVIAGRAHWRDHSLILGAVQQVYEVGWGNRVTEVHVVNVIGLAVSVSGVL